MTVDEAKKIVQERAELSDETMAFLFAYRYGDNLVIKLAKAML